MIFVYYTVDPCLQVKERCMPKDFLGGPDREKSTATERGTFFPATPQVFY